MGMTQPRPVTTARRDGSVSGKKGYLRDRGGRADCSDPQASVAVVTLEDHCPVVAAEADVVAEGVADRVGRGLGHDPEVTVRIRVAEVDRRRDALLGHRLD